MNNERLACLTMAGLVAWGFYPADGMAESASTRGWAPNRITEASYRPDLFVDGVVRMVDRAGGNIILRHGPIENLGIPPMTMTFRIIDSRLIESLEAGTAVRFAADRLEGKFTIVHLERR
ncbi:MAG: copper-binding protein [Burkholderiales bacterium]